MTWLMPSVIATMLGTAILAFIYYYLYLTDRKRYLVIWALSWSIYFTRFLFMLGIIMGFNNAVMLIGNQITSLASGIILLWGTYQFIEKKFPKVWFYCSGLGIIWIVFSISFKFPFYLMAIPTFSFLAVVYIWTGISFIKSKITEGYEQTVTGWAFIIWGVHKADYPFLRPVIWFAPWGYLLGALLEFIVALGMLLVYFQKTRSDLKVSEKRLSLIVENMPVMMDALDKDSNVIAWNKECERVTGYSAEEMIGNPRSLEILYPDAKYREEMIDELIALGFDFREKEYYLTCKDGTKKMISWSNISGRIPIPGWTTWAIGVDITDRKRAEGALMKSEERHRSILKTAMDGFWLTDSQGRLLEVNETYCCMSGYSEEELLNMCITDLEAIEKPEDVDDHIKRINVQGQDRFESQHRRKDGSLFDVEVSVQYRVDEGGRFVCFLRDITDRRRTEQALRESEKRFKNLADSLPEAVFEADANMKLTYVNQQAFSLFGYSQKDFEKGLNALEMLAYKDRKRAQSNISKRFHKKEIGMNEYIGIRKDGSTFPILLHATPIIHEETVKGLRGIIIDISDRKRIQSQLQQAQKIESIGNLSGGIAHDFNNILFPIVGMSELLMEDLPASSLERESANQIFKAAMRGRDLVKQILAFSRQSEHKMIPLQIQQVLKEIIDLSRSTIPSYIEISQDIQDNCGLVMADPSQIHQITMNLITNAYNAVEPNGGKIEINLNEKKLADEDLKGLSIEPGRYVVLSINDTGTGIDPSIMNQIFDPYFTTKEKGKGTGLGLAVVHGLVKEHGGDIKVNSEMGKGATFTVYLPRIVEKVETAAIEKDATLSVGHERILLVDDEEAIVYLEKQMLERLGYRIKSRTSSVEALAAFKANPDEFDVVITDMTMPNKTGESLALELMSIKPDIPIIICTGFSDRLDKEKAKAMGIKGFLMKPVVLSEMAKMVRKVLDEARDNL